MKDITALDET